MDAGAPGFGAEQVWKVAHLARLALDEGEVDRYAAQLAMILGYMEELRRVPTAGVAEVFPAPAGGNAWRPDESGSSLPVADTLANAPAREGDFVRVPPVMASRPMVSFVADYRKKIPPAMRWRTDGGAGRYPFFADARRPVRPFICTDKARDTVASVNSLAWEPAWSLREKMAQGELSPRGLLEALRRHHDAVEPGTGAFLRVDWERARERALTLENTRAAGAVPGKLYGVPVALKDNLCVAGEISTCGSRILENFRPPYSAHVAERLLAEGAVLLGRTNMDEFAMGSSCENSAFAVTRNPWDRDRVPGGSSGGSAAAVASGQVPLALGSDTGGSIRQPAALCGVVGFKPTYGFVSRYGLIAFASSLDQIGPFGRSVRDAALLLAVVGGPDPRDSTSRPGSRGLEDLADFTPASLRGVRFGLPTECFPGDLSPDVAASLEILKTRIGEAGASLVPVSLPRLKNAIAAYYIIAPAEASSNLARYDGVQYGFRAEAADLVGMVTATRGKGFGAEVKRRIMLGTYTLSRGYHDAYYRKALQVRTLIREDFVRAYGQADWLLTPTTPSPAFRLGEKTDNPLEMYLSDIFTVAVNLAGLPGVSLPCGLAGGKLPIGAQIIGPAGSDAGLLRVAGAVEALTGWNPVPLPLREGAAP